MKDSSKILIGLLTGAAAGIALGILLKPKQTLPVKKVSTPLFGNLANRVSNNVNETLINRFKTDPEDFEDHVEHTAF